MTNPLQDPFGDAKASSGLKAMMPRRPLQTRQQNVIVGEKLVRDSTNLNETSQFFLNFFRSLYLYSGLYIIEIARAPGVRGTDGSSR